MFALLSCLKRPRRVQSHCIPRVLEGRHVLGINETGSDKTTAFALPIVHRLSEHPFSVFALVVMSTRELAFQLPEQFRALDSCLHLRIAVVVSGMDMLRQTKELAARPHVIIAMPGRIKALLENPDIPLVFARTKFLVLDEADRVLDVSFQEELKFIFKCLPENRQNLFFSATTTSNGRYGHPICHCIYLYMQMEREELNLNKESNNNNVGGNNSRSGGGGFIDRSKVRILLCDNDSKSSEENHSLLHGKVIRVMWSRRDPDVRKNGRGNVFVKNLAESIDNAGLHDLFQKFGNILSNFGNCFGASNWFRGSDDSDTVEKPREREFVERLEANFHD
ncbi:DEAD-box ATP-dependent RNA helicase [Arachis hypogaea]|uniref:DEAD-box ATP-dependent RNA helicase n=1 Tax=Arachis hypogaea TaxID=3818 RepID=A0A6B9VC83_ARAHY|nr:DEAD-box ATP-dependent RNA helicase [Arachis hypogaea]